MKRTSFHLAVVVYYMISLSLPEPDCPIGSRYEYPADCRQYFTCDNGSVSQVSCPKSQHFHRADLHCRDTAVCHMMPIRTLTAKHCYLPFIYSGNMHYNCTPEDEYRGLYWCATEPTFALDNYDYCNDNQTTFYIGDFITRTGNLVHQDDCGEFTTDANSNGTSATAFYIYKANSSSYQFDVDLNIDASAANVSGIMYNVHDKDQYDYVYLQFGNNETCITHGRIDGLSMQPSGGFVDCDNASTEIGEWISLTLRVFHPDMAHLLINGELITDQLEPTNCTIGWVGLIVDSNVSVTLRFREARLSELHEVTTLWDDDENQTTGPPSTVETKPTERDAPHWENIISDRLLFAIYMSALGALLLLCILTVIMCLITSRERKRQQRPSSSMTSSYLTSSLTHNTFGST